MSDLSRVFVYRLCHKVQSWLVPWKLDSDGQEWTTSLCVHSALSSFLCPRKACQWQHNNNLVLTTQILIAYRLGPRQQTICGVWTHGLLEFTNIPCLAAKSKRQTKVFFDQVAEKHVRVNFSSPCVNTTQTERDWISSILEAQGVNCCQVTCLFVNWKLWKWSKDGDLAQDW